MPISPIGPNNPIRPPQQVNQPVAPEQAQGQGEGQDFGTRIAGAMDQLQETQRTADEMAVKAATGDLSDIHDYMIASTEAQVATQVTVAVRNRAIESFNQIMNMQV